MIEEQGRVLSTEGRWALIEPLTGGACGSCSARSGCGTSALGRFLGGRRHAFRALNRAQARPGDRVRIGIDEGRLAGASLLMYLWPLLAMIGGAIMFQRLAWPSGLPADLQALIGAVLGLGGAFWLVRRLAIRGGHRFHPVVLEVLDAAQTPVTLHLPHA